MAKKKKKSKKGSSEMVSLVNEDSTDRGSDEDDESQTSRSANSSLPGSVNGSPAQKKGKKGGKKKGGKYMVSDDESAASSQTRTSKSSSSTKGPKGKKLKAKSSKSASSMGSTAASSRSSAASSRTRSSATSRSSASSRSQGSTEHSGSEEGSETETGYDESEYDEDISEGEEEEEEGEEEWTTEHLLLLYMISKYAKDDSASGGASTWIRETPLLVLIYEGIINNALDYDYAPQCVLLGTRNVWMNISQDGKDDLNQLRERNTLTALKRVSENFQSITAFQVSAYGLEVMEQLDFDSRKDIEQFIYAPPPDQDKLLRARWDNSEEDPDDHGFMLALDDGTKISSSTVTDTEDVSYVASPWLPQVLRKRGREASSNAHRAHESGEGRSTIVDDLDEVITLRYVNLLVGEWIPFGANQIVALNERLGAYDRCKGGMFTSKPDTDPTGNSLELDPGLTQVDILDFDHTEYINFEAEINFPEDDDIVQVEFFGMHLAKLGETAYGMRIEAVLDRGADNVSLDHLSRLLVDVHQDSSKIVDSLLSGYQRNLLNMIYMDFPLQRDKFNMIMAEDIEPHLTAAEYLDQDEKQCELTQVIGPVYDSHDLGEEDFVILGRVGVLVVGPNSKQFETVLMCYLSLMAREMFVRAFFVRTFILSDELSTIRRMILNNNEDPTYVHQVRDKLSKCSRDIIMMQGLLGVLTAATKELQLPKATRGGGAVNQAVLEELLKVFGLETKRDDLIMRVSDLSKTVTGSLNELNNLAVMTDVINKKQLEEVFRDVQVNTKVLVDASKAAERASKSLEVMQVVISASMAFDLIDRFTGFNQGIDTEGVPWMDFITQNLIYPPGVWFGFNAVICCAMCYALIRFMKSLGDASLGFLSLRYKLNRPISIPRWNEFLTTRPDPESSDTVSGTVVKRKLTWEEEEDEEHWRGSAPTIEVEWEAQDGSDSGFLLKVALNLDTKGHLWQTENEVRDIWLEDLRNAGVFDLRTK